MFRFRRYRVFLVFAVVFVFALYKFGQSGTTWRDAASTAAELKNEAEGALGFGTKPRPPIAHETKKLELHIPAAISSQALQTPPPLKNAPTPSRLNPVVTERPQQKPSIPSIPSQIQPQRPAQNAQPPPAYPASTSIEPIHWTKLPEQFAVPPNSVIKLPSGKPKPIPKIQFEFKPESAAVKADRLAKLGKIKDVFKKSWNGYREYAWLRDELRPQSGTFKDPFAGWGATLVDALDTLWIMGLKDEFEEAAKAVDKIDFTTTSRADIPLFETTIRYLGGLVAAYDVSGKRYKNLLTKAVELAEVLISAFDTPNRMPKTYYYWRPQFASQKHRADGSAVLAEIGSLSMEFTRLAQLTGDHKYYDAIARITDNLEEFQNNTRLPGMWPTYLDASGCGRVYVETPAQEPLHAPEGYFSTAYPSPTNQLSPEGHEYIPLQLPDPVVLKPNGVNPTYVESISDSPATAAAQVIGSTLNAASRPRVKRQLEDIAESPAESDNADPIKPVAAVAATPQLPECVPQGFVSTSKYGREEYTLGGMSDSTYEYLPKEYLLLGGRVEKYRTMYEQSMDVVKKHMIFRPMLPKEEDVLFCGKLNVPSTKDKENKVGDLEPENAHLTCFAGGMFGMGAKLFDRPEDLEIAKKLTEGCVLSYNMTNSGIMPESFEAIACESTKSCAWNETLYWETIDPQSEYRLKSYDEAVKVYESQFASASSWYEEQLAAMTAPPQAKTDAGFPVLATQTPILADTLDKRQLGDQVDDGVPIAAASPSVPIVQDPALAQNEAVQPTDAPTRVIPTVPIQELQEEPSPALPVFPYVYSPTVPKNHKQFVENRIKEERLPTGVTRIGSKNYILRPEAIESVWYMYRITGDNHWREAGWRMFLAIDEHTSTKYGNSAIDDVTKLEPTLNDAMESFWLAETLKYFYLLFETENVVSLDEWVLNTEAHPFQRPT